jgi:hypothetical protein
VEECETGIADRCVVVDDEAGDKTSDGPFHNPILKDTLRHSGDFEDLRESRGCLVSSEQLATE